MNTPIKITSLDLIPERECVTVRIKTSNNVVRDFEIQSLSGYEAESLEAEKDHRQKELLLERPKPPMAKQRQTGKNIMEDTPNYDDPEYQRKMVEYNNKMDAIDRWYGYKLLEYGFFNKHGFKIEGTTEEERIRFMQQKLSVYSAALANQIARLSTVKSEDVENF